MPVDYHKTSSQLQGEVIVKEMKKHMSKESKEMKKMIESTVKTIVQDQDTQVKKKIEDLVAEGIKQHMTEYNVRILKLEGDTKAKLDQFEGNINALTESSLSIEKNLNDALNKLGKESKNNIEEERQKRLSLIKKLNTKLSDQISKLEDKLKATKEECEKGVKFFKGDLDEQAQLISKLQENLDEMYVFITIHSFITNINIQNH